MQLAALRDRMETEGKLHSRTRLKEFYNTFHLRFGPSVPSSLDGEALLSTMHLHGNRESLVYWLEFKDDDELPGIFGSIAGGSALKFGIFRHKDTGEWHGREYPVPISVDDATVKARQHRRDRGWVAYSGQRYGSDCAEG